MVSDEGIVLWYFNTKLPNKILFYVHITKPLKLRGLKFHYHVRVTELHIMQHNLTHFKTLKLHI